MVLITGAIPPPIKSGIATPFLSTQENRSSYVYFPINGLILEMVRCNCHGYIIDITFTDNI